MKNRDVGFLCKSPSGRLTRFHQTPHKKEMRGSHVTTELRATISTRDWDKKTEDLSIRTQFSTKVQLNEVIWVQDSIQDFSKPEVLTKISLLPRPETKAGAAHHYYATHSLHCIMVSSRYATISHDHKSLTPPFVILSHCWIIRVKTCRQSNGTQMPNYVTHLKL